MAEEPHPEAQSVIDRSEQDLFPSTHALAAESARERLEKLFAAQPSEDVENVVNFSIEGPESDIPMRMYEPDVEPPYPILLYLHGGGFVAGSPDTHDNVCAALTNRADCLTVSVDYRRAPEHPFPAAVEDAYAALGWASEYADDIDGDADRLAIAGDSAGGNLATVATLMARDRGGPEVCHQALVYPVVASPLLHEFDSYEENGEGYLLELESTKWYVDQYVQNDVHMRNAYLAPLLARDLSGLPPTTLVTAGFDLHRDEGFAYADRLADAEVPVEHHNYEEMIHSFVSLYSLISQGEDAIETVATNLRDAFED